MGLGRLLSDIAGKACEIILPIRHDVFMGNTNSSIALCTLSSMDLLLEVSRSDIMQYIAIAGRLLSENKGIDALVRYVTANEGIRCIVLAGRDSKGHRAGQSLLALWANGMDESGRIVGSLGRDAVLTVSMDQVTRFRAQINTIVDMIGVTDLGRIRKRILALSS
ncbi:MAG: hypothetical protein RMJ59_03425 [Candidatus Nitrosocaldus sp.]|nr:hypothetical protein [Candidatus Nitrosocaldus sp.]MDW8275418.1 hypothetical protein [Candidatus Nitrosocaldus sp.]